MILLFNRCRIFYSYLFHTIASLCLVPPPVDGEEPDEEKVKDLLNSIEKYALASHLFWGLWGIISVGSFSRSLSDVTDSIQ
jgi:hypothetical protein